jgi:hypothetical protein
LPLSSTSQGLLSVQRPPSSLPVLLTATTLPVALSTTGEPEVPPIVWQAEV